MTRHDGVVSDTCPVLSDVVSDVVSDPSVVKDVMLCSLYLGRSPYTFEQINKGLGFQVSDEFRRTSPDGRVQTDEFTWMSSHG